jgi:hypothetical protein
MHTGDLCLPVHDSEQLRQTFFPPAMSTRWRLNGKCMVGSVVTYNGDSTETEAKATSEFQNGREPANLDKVVVAIDVL